MTTTSPLTRKIALLALIGIIAFCLSFGHAMTSPEAAWAGPKATKIKSVTAKKPSSNKKSGKVVKNRTVKVKWAKVSGVKGYKVQYATNKSFKNAKTIKVKGAKKTSYIIKKLKANTTYYVRVRTYKGSSTSKWSDAKMVRTGLIIVIDPGHGGNSSKTDLGARSHDKGMEKTVNLALAKKLKAGLETYAGVKVYLTRSTDKSVSLDARTNYANAKKADLFISVHNNAKGWPKGITHGSMALTPLGNYHSLAADKADGTAKAILQQLGKLGLTNNGLQTRAGSGTYPNGKKTDYYAVINGCVSANIPGMIVEHAYMDNKAEYDEFLSNDEGLNKLAQADATGIASYYKLQKK